MIDPNVLDVLENTYTYYEYEEEEEVKVLAYIDGDFNVCYEYIDPFGSIVDEEYLFDHGVDIEKKKQEALKTLLLEERCDTPRQLERELERRRDKDREFDYHRPFARRPF